MKLIHHVYFFLLALCLFLIKYQGERIEKAIALLGVQAESHQRMDREYYYSQPTSRFSRELEYETMATYIGAEIRQEGGAYRKWKLHNSKD